MCLAVPMRVIKIDRKNKRAIAEARGVKREISTMLLTEDVKPGDYVAVHVGYALDVIEAEKAKEILAIFEEMEKHVRDSSEQ